MGDKMKDQTTWSFYQVKSKLQEIKEMGFIETIRAHDTGIGHTLEQLLGLTENNISMPDFGKLELKSHRKESASMITIFTKSPDLISNRELLDKYGYQRQSDGRLVLHQTIYLDRPNAQGWVLKYNSKEASLYLCKNTEKLGAYSRNLIIKKFSEKIGDGVILVFAKRIKIDIRELFHYDEAYLLKNFYFDEFIRYLRYDIRMGRYPDGSVHDHGSAFRLRKSDLNNVFQIYEKLL